tara:strand:+ start:122 stop:493 length:372 start_codon:yes stop_codon:yes gene_type:complete
MSIRLSEKHGVNPSIHVCYFCQKSEDGEIVLAGRLPGDKKAPHRASWHEEPCAECRGYMKQGIILISVRDGEPRGNPYRTGGWCVVREDAVRRIFPEAIAEEAASMRFCFVEDAPWDIMGLPR